MRGQQNSRFREGNPPIGAPVPVLLAPDSAVPDTLKTQPLLNLARDRVSHFLLHFDRAYRRRMF
jgi:hypothetical protein